MGRGIEPRLPELLKPSEGSSPNQKSFTVFIRFRDEENQSGSKPMPTFDPADLIGRTFLLPPEEKWGWQWKS